MVVHILHWWYAGRSLGRFVMSDSTRTIEAGEINPGFLLFAGSLLVTGLFGRFMCGWVCHMGALQDACAWLLRRCGVRPRLFRSRMLGYVPLGMALYLFVWPTIRRTVALPLMAWFGMASPASSHEVGFPGFSLDLHTERMWEGLPALATAIPFLLVCGAGTVFFLGARGLCRYGCPYGGFLLPAASVAPFRVRADLARCDQCGLCTSACTAGVRVHDQVREIGSITDHNCIRSLDCVAVCPQQALSFGLAPSSPRAASHSSTRLAPYDLTLAEELICLCAFLAVFLVTRGLYGLVPMLMAVTLGILAAFVAWKVLRLLRESNVRLGPWQMRLHGRLRAPGVVFLLFSVCAGVVVVHSAAVRSIQFLASRQDDLVHVSFDHAVAGAVAPRELDAARRARDLYAMARPIGSGGIALASTPESDFRLAWMRLVCGEDDGAVDLLAIMSATQRTQDAATVQAARLLFALSRPEEAERLLEACISTDPMALGSRDFLANVWVRTGRTERAEAMYRSMLADRPGDTLARAGAGRAAFALGRGDEGLALLREAAARAPENTEVRRDLALALLASGQADEAAKELEAAAAARPARGAELRSLAQQIRSQAR